MKFVHGNYEKEFDNTDIELCEKYLKASKRLGEDAQKMGDGIDALVKGCEAIDRFFDTMFGKGTAAEIFGSRRSFKEHMEAARDFIIAFQDQSEMSALTQELTSRWGQQ